MKKLAVLIVLLVFGLSFLGASSAFGKDKIPRTPELYYFEETTGDPPTKKRCYVEVLVRKNSLLTVIDGDNCRTTDVGAISELNLRVGDSPATPSSPVWIYYSSSPGRYCYVHPLTGQYQCIYWP